MKPDYTFMTKSLLLIMLPSLVVLPIPETGLANVAKDTVVPEQKKQFLSIDDISITQWKRLAQRKIYFGHHSVGDNIVDGIKDLMVENPNIKINIVKSTNEADFQEGIFAHSRVGTNSDPKSKIDDFIKFLDKGIGREADIAGFKLCYADILWHTNVNRILNDYKHSLADLKKKYPNLKIIHFTTPLNVQRTTWKNVVKKILNIEDPWRYGSNIKRNYYNKKIIEKYQGKDLIFDIATIESTYPDGARCIFEVKGRTYYSLVPEYTSDGGHLNKVGRKKVAEQLILYLANLD